MNRIISSWGSRVPWRESRRSLEDLIGPAGFGKFPLETLVLLLQALARRRWFYLVAVSVTPQPQGLLAHANLRGNDPYRV
ncbi:hypothetical protein [Buchananella hordeovulneris]|uniref:hypothetical protein n=1 Tax=Buchananella hordeovulneris TaxID=52770 RepID=UPI0011612505|nr:hypothetical protein [Buchananella hordeovulneris]